MRGAIGNHDRRGVGERAGDISAQRRTGTPAFHAVKERKLLIAHGQHQVGDGFGEADGGGEGAAEGVDEGEGRIDGSAEGRTDGDGVLDAEGLAVGEDGVG